MIKDMKLVRLGRSQVEYPLDEKPLLWPFVTKTLGLAPDCKKDAARGSREYQIPRASHECRLHARNEYRAQA